MRIIAIVLILIVLLFAAVFVVIGLMSDKDYAFERSLFVPAPPAEVHALAGDFARWMDWSPFNAKAPGAVVTLGKTTSGVGATQSSANGDDVLEFEILKTDPARGVEYEMVFVSGDRRTPCHGVISYEVVDGGTIVTWAMDGRMEMPILGGFAASTMDARFGPLFEKGLKELLNAIEAGKKTADPTDSKK